MNPARLLHQMISSEGEHNPSAPAILAPGKETLPYRELSHHLKSIALQLTRLGIRPGDRLAVVLPNSPEMATAFLAVSAVCTCAPLNPAYRQDEFKFSLQELHIKALVTCYGSEAPIRQAADNLGIPVINLEADARIAGYGSRCSCCSAAPSKPPNQAVPSLWRSARPPYRPLYPG